MPDRNETKLSDCKISAGDRPASPSRRNFTKASLLASPVVMAVISRPVFGVECLSGQLSGNLSDHDHGECVVGLSPGYWMNHPEDWPSPIVPDSPDPQDGNFLASFGGQVDCKKKPRSKNKKDDDNKDKHHRFRQHNDEDDNGEWHCSGGTKFNSLFMSNQDPYNRSMYRVICESNNEPVYGQRHIVAAYLNSLKFRNYILSSKQVINLWNDPTYGGKIGDIKAFLDGTWA